jgi:hypothetical protein
MRFASIALVVASITFVAAVAAGCGPKKESQGAPGTWSQVYSQVIAVRCAPCHTTPAGPGIQLGHLNMTSQTAAYSNLVNVATAGSACAGVGTRIVPGQPDSSILYLKVSLDDPSPCGLKMPAAGGPLSQDEVNLIESWINAGAQNN